MIIAHTLSAEVRAALAAPNALHASPTFVLCGRRTRGRFAARRQTRAGRSDARRLSSDAATNDLGLCLQAITNAWSIDARK